MIRILSLDTSSKHSSIAAFREEQLLGEYNLTNHDELSASLIPFIDRVLNNLGLKLNDIDLFGIGIGPGLFTGIRVGLAAIKGMIFADKKPVVPVTTLKALAYRYMSENLTIIPLIDAKRDEVYAAAYDVSGEEIEEIVPPSLVHIRELKNALPGEMTNFCFVGSGAEAHPKILAKKFPKNKILPRSTFLAAEIGKIAYRDFLQENYIKNVEELLPLYIRKPDAEQKHLQREKGANRS